MLLFRSPADRLLVCYTLICLAFHGKEETNRGSVGRRIELTFGAKTFFSMFWHLNVVVQVSSWSALGLLHFDLFGVSRQGGNKSRFSWPEDWADIWCENILFHVLASNWWTTPADWLLVWDAWNQDFIFWFECNIFRHFFRPIWLLLLIFLCENIRLMFGIKPDLAWARSILGPCLIIFFHTFFGSIPEIWSLQLAALLKFS